MRTGEWNLPALALAAALALGCGSSATTGPNPIDHRCVPNMSVACACAGGVGGVQTCGADGTFGACRCDARDAGSAAADAGMDAVSAPVDGAVACPAGTTPVDGTCLADEEVGGIGGALADCPPALTAPLAGAYRITCGFRCHGDRAPGIDYAAPMGTVVYAPIAGTVITAVNSAPARPSNATARTPGCSDRGAGFGICCGSGFGNHVVIKDRQGRQWFLGHMVRDSVVVTRGDVVRAGQPVGRLGNSGFTCASAGGDAAHVHLSVKVANAWTDFTACVRGDATPVAASVCRDQDLDTYGAGAGCDAEDCDDNQANFQSWNRAHTACLGAEPGGSACADRDNDGAMAGADCPTPDEDCDDFDPRVTTGCRRCAGAMCGMTAPSCGDGTCSGGETCTSCPSDCRRAEVADYEDNDCDGRVDNGVRAQLRRLYYSSGGGCAAAGADWDHCYSADGVTCAGSGQGGGAGYASDAESVWLYPLSLGGGADTITVGPYLLARLDACYSASLRAHRYVTFDFRDRPGAGWTCSGVGYVRTGSMIGAGGNGLFYEHHLPSVSDYFYSVQPAEGAGLPCTASHAPAWFAWTH